MDERESTKSLMEETGLGLLPGVAAALAIVVFSMALLLTGSMWAVFGVLGLIGAVMAAVLTVVVALIDEGARGEWLRARIPGLAPRSTPDGVPEEQTRCF